MNASGGYKYKFSIIMAVYKVEDFIAEAIDSIINQDIGFESVQLILVDDGSPDGAGAIADSYSEKYPENIFVIHKENGGVSSARNAGLAIAEGRYVNFTDPDDILTPDTLRLVYEFYEEHGDECNVVGIPLETFGAVVGQHYLNNKFAKGSRVISLEEENDCLQLSSSCAFIKLECAKEMHFDETMAVAEDAQQMMRLLIDKPYLGVVAEAKYLYRRHAGSAMSSGLKKAWYLTYIRSFSLKTLEYAREVYGFIPSFVQYAVMNNFQWRLSEENEPTALDADELAEYKSEVMHLLSLIDDEIILAQKFCNKDVAIHLIAKKHENEEYVTLTDDDIILGISPRVDSRLSTSSLLLDFLTVKKDVIEISVRKISIYTRLSGLYLTVGGERIMPTRTADGVHRRFIGEPMAYSFSADFVIPRGLLQKENKIRFFAVAREREVHCINLICKPNFPIEHKYKAGYYFKDGLAFTLPKDSLNVTKAKRAGKYERRLLRELWRSNGLGERKAVVARTLASIYKAFHKKPVWIISDRINKAGDNGEAFFRYLAEIGYKGADFRFATQDETALTELSKIGKTIRYGGFYYKIVHLAADMIISSHADLPTHTPFPNYSQPYKDIIASQKRIFLQHGITKDDISGWLNRHNKNLAGFVTSALPEWRSIIEGNYLYGEDVVWLTGMARFDRLYRDEKKYITLMPTWRSYLMSGFDSKTGTWSISERFKESSYYKFYNALLNDERLLSACEEKGYTLCFLPHPNIISNISVFDKDERVKFFSLEDEYRDIYAKSNLVLTDYSSAAFDFSYLRKPIVYAHFDSEEFFSGSHVYTKGYFDYERDGFGEVCYDYDATVDLLIEYIRGDCALKEKYKERIDGFFYFDDFNNCQRILAKIEELYPKFL